MKLEAAAAAKALATQAGAAEILIAGEGESPRVDEFPAEFDVLLRDMPHRFVNAASTALFPAEPVVVLLDARTGQPPTAQTIAPSLERYSSAAAGQAHIPLRPKEGEYLLLALPGGPAVQPEIPFESPVLLANFVQLTGYDIRCKRGELQWALHWQTAGGPDPADYHIFNHLLDAGGQRFAQADAAAFSPAQWQTGERVISFFTLSLPDSAPAAAPAPWLMRVGMYRYPSLEAVPVLDVAANPAADWLEIPLIACP
jgi:hypothetical protein